MKTAFRVIAFLEGLSYILLLFIAVPVKYQLGNEVYVKIIGMPHGLLFLAYLIMATRLKLYYNWQFKIFFIVLVASIIPFGTFYIDRKII